MKQSDDQRTTAKANRKYNTKTSRKYNTKNNTNNNTKRNAEARTPEEMKRAEEILLWMGDIRDDFILEAEDYKHYQNDKRVPGYFIVGGTLAAAAAVCTAIFFQTGHNRIWKDNDPMQLPYQTEESRETEWETETETETEETENEETETETTEPETTEGASQEEAESSTEEMTENPTEEVTSLSEETVINVTQEVSQEILPGISQDNGWLGQSKNYQFLVQTDESTISVYNAWDGSLETSITGKLLPGKKCVLVKTGDRVPITNLQTVGYQMYVGGELQLSQEFYTYWNQLSDMVFTSSDSALYSPGKLYSMNGVQLTEDNQIFSRVGDHIYSEDYVYDLDGQLLGSHPSFTAQYEFDNYVLGCDFNTYEYTMFDLDTMTTVWTVSDWLYPSCTNDLLNWETADGQGIVTDLMLNPKLKEEDWLAQNADWALNGSHIHIACENKQTGEVIIYLLENQEGAYIYHYYACDSQYNIIEELPEEFIYTYYEDNVCVPLTYHITDDGLLTITNFWTKETIVTASVDLRGGEIYTIDVSSVGPMYGITINTINPNDIVTLLISNGTVISESRDYAVLQESVVQLDEDTIAVYENGTNPNTLYFNINGEPLKEQDAQAIYADRYATCTMQDGKFSVTPRGAFAYNLPIAADEYLVLTTGGGSYSWLGGDLVVILNSAGEEVLRLPGYGITGNGASMSNGMIVNENTPLVLYTGYEDGVSNASDYVSAQMGIYSLKDRNWIVEPARQSVTLFSDSVYMIGSEVGNLYRTDGTCIEEGAEGVTVQDNYIVSRRAVYDKTGQMVLTLQENESVREVLYDEILINEYLSDGSHYTKRVNANGETIWTEQSGLTWTGGDKSWRIHNSWNDTNGKGLLTATRDDNTLKIVLTEDEFFAKNPSAQGSGLRLIAMTANFDGSFEFFLQTTAGEHEEQKYFYRCDHEFHVIDTYPQNQIYVGEFYNDVCLWYWGLDENGNGIIENLIYDNKMEVDAEIMNEILQCPDVQAMQAGNIIGLLFDQNKCFLYGTDNDTHVLREDGGITARMTTQNNGGAVEVYILSNAYAENEHSEVLYYTSDGTLLNDDTALFANSQLNCVQESDRIVIKDGVGAVREEIAIK